MKVLQHFAAVPVRWPLSARAHLLKQTPKGLLFDCLLLVPSWPGAATATSPLPPARPLAAGGHAPERPQPTAEPPATSRARFASHGHGEGQN